VRFTPQYAGLEALYRKYSKDGLVIWLTAKLPGIF
jgi:glutathione peroxidase-family protein